MSLRPLETEWGNFEFFGCYKEYNISEYDLLGLLVRQQRKLVK